MSSREQRAGTGLAPSGWRAGWRGLRTVLALTYQAAPRLFLELFAAVTISSLATLLASALALKLLTDGALAGSTSTVLIAVAAIAGGWAARTLANRVYVNHAVKIQEIAQQRIDERLVELTSRIPGVEHLERPEYLDELELLRERRTALGQLPNALALNATVFLPLIGGAFLLATIHPLLALLPLVVLPALYFDRRAITVDERAREASVELTRERRHLFERATAAEAGKEIRLFGVAGELIDRHDQVSAAFVRAIDRANVRSTALRLASAVFFALGVVGAVAFVLRLAFQGRATPGEVVLAVTLARQVNGSVMGLAGLGSYLGFVAQQSARYLWLLDYSHEARRSVAPVEPAAMPTALVEGIALDRVSFQYPGTDHQVLQDLSLQLPAGAVVALVGENGAGKTTLVKLLARLYEPTAGRVLVDGEPLANLDPDAWQQSISMASQDFARFEFLAREAVGVGHLPQVEEDRPVHGAIERAGATRVLSSLPTALDTQLGRTWPDGVELSGGEWQQLALGRAFMRPDPLLVIFDEPTAAIDAPTEHALFERFADQSRTQANRGTVTLIVSHRFSTVRMADLIVVLDAGTVREVGSHAELMERDDLYAELYSLQARAYQ